MLIDAYNDNGWNNLFSYHKLEKVEQFLASYDNLEHIGHGGTCVAFRYDNIVLKVCLKNNSVLKTGDTFKNYEQMLIKNNIKILPVIDIIYEDDMFFIYRQVLCDPIYTINILIFKKILLIILELFKNKIKITDLFYKNFGIYQNDVYLYDYHDYGYFYSDDNYYITHLGHIFRMYQTNTLLINIKLDTDQLANINFGKNILKDDEVLLLEKLYNYQYDEAILILQNIIKNIKIAKSYDNYQHYDISSDGIIQLRDHTLAKYMIVEKLINKYSLEKFTLIDYGCSLGGIGSTVAQNYPNSLVTLNNITRSELNICSELVNNLILPNVKISDANIINDNNTYTVCLYFAILHHILKVKTMDEIINMLSTQVGKYAIIELPFDVNKDALLKDVIRHASLNYQDSFYYLESIDIFIEKIKPTFKVIYQCYVDYKSTDLNRYAMILEKII